MEPFRAPREETPIKVDQKMSVMNPKTKWKIVRKVRNALSVACYVLGIGTMLTSPVWFIISPPPSVGGTTQIGFIMFLFQMASGFAIALIGDEVRA